MRYSTCRLAVSDCLFHVHTSVTDGELAPYECVQIAKQHGLSGIVFLEHVRREPSYDALQFIRGVRDIGLQLGVTVAAGFEARILRDGSLNINPELIHYADVIGIAEHGSYGCYDDYEATVRLAIKRCSELAQAKDVVWVHPGLWVKRAGLLTSHFHQYRDMLEFALSEGLMIERNLRYCLPPGRCLPSSGKESIVIGVDAHSRRDVERWLRAVRMAGRRVCAEVKLCRGTGSGSTGRSSTDAQSDAI